VGKQSAVATAVEQAEQKPESKGRAQTLEEEVTAAKLGSDETLLKAAVELIKQIQATPGGQQVVSQVITGNQNVVAGRDITIPSLPK
jgi:hypothetical protein